MPLPDMEHIVAEIHPRDCTSDGDCLPRSRGMDHKKGGAPVSAPAPHWPRLRRYVGSFTEVPKMSVFPKVAGHSCCTAGAGRSSSEPSVRSDIRYASMAGQSAPFLASFHTNVA